MKKDLTEVNTLGLFGESDLKSILSEAGLTLGNEDAQFDSWLACLNSGTTWAMEMRPREYFLAADIKIRADVNGSCRRSDKRRSMLLVGTKVHGL